MKRMENDEVSAAPMTTCGPDDAATLTGVPLQQGMNGMINSLHIADQVVKAAFDAPMHQPPPQMLVDLILRAKIRPPTAKPAYYLAFARRLPSRYAMPLAASLALMTGVGFGVLLGPFGGAASNTADLKVGDAPVGSALHHALETQPSSAAGEARAGRTAIVTTFRDMSGRVCREFEQAGDSGVTVAGIACRSQSRGWAILGAVQLVEIKTGGNSTYAPSGAPEAEPLAGLLTLLGAGSVLSGDEEAHVMAKGWK